jgi:hypothetical protein
MIAYYSCLFLDVLSLRERWDARRAKEKRDRPGEPGKAGVRNNKKNTTEASMLLKTKEGVCKTKLKRTQIEPQLSAEMRALRVEFDFSDTLQVLAEASNGKDDCGRSHPVGGIQRAAREYENRGNEAKKLLKTQDITVLNGANFALFACKFAQIRA